MKLNTAGSEGLAPPGPRDSGKERNRKPTVPSFLLARLTVVAILRVPNPTWYEDRLRHVLEDHNFIAAAQV